MQHVKQTNLVLKSLESMEISAECTEWNFNESLIQKKGGFGKLLE